MSNPNPAVEFQGLFNYLGLQLDQRFQTEMANLTNLHDVDFAALGQNVAALMAATDGDDSQSGFQLLNALRSDLNAVIAKAGGNESALSALATVVADLDTALRAFVDGKIAIVNGRLDAVELKATNNASGLQTETQRALTKENELEAAIGLNATTVGTLSQGLQAEVLARQTEKTEIDLAIAAGADVSTALQENKLDAAWAVNLIASVPNLKAAFDSGLAGQTV